VPAGLPEGGVTVTTRAATQSALADDPLTQLIQQSLIVLGVTAGILAIAALWAAVAAARRERADQEAVLVALGISGRRQALVQAAEILAVAGPAAGAGLAIGILLSRLMLPYLTLTSTGTIPVPAIVIVVSWLPSLALAAAMVAGPALAAALAVVATRADAAARLRSLDVASATSSAPAPRRGAPPSSAPWPGAGSARPSCSRCLRAQAPSPPPWCRARTPRRRVPRCAPNWPLPAPAPHRCSAGPI
jgi:predicted lysophospholipase L1 biosynthesis ABC-type transport system permease subunit